MIVASAVFAALALALLGLRAAAPVRTAEASLNGPFALKRTSDRVDLACVRAAEFRAQSAGALRACEGRGKRALDIAAALCLLLVAAPVMLVTALLIKCDSPGPVLYRQRRVGRDGAVFDILKFRSMTLGAEPAGPQWAERDDPRATRVGRLIRKWRIDEIPQAVNVLKGEMSFVGPRPERPEFVVLLEREIPNYQLRHMVRPGITGWAQVKYVYGASVEDARVKLQYDLHYVRNFTLLRDLYIILLTVKVALFGLKGG